MTNTEKKVKISFECTIDEKAYIKILAAREHLSISEYMLSRVRPYFPKEKLNQEFWEKMERNT